MMSINDKEQGIKSKKKFFSKKTCVKKEENCRKIKEDEE